ncbi:MAG TPA: hypothetical protein ENK26_08855 [Gammaproteobacteria bacterium]|nr:hypothetical protein [Gammaproteobacteria bacterium]
MSNTNKESYSEEYLNALVDNEFPPAEKAERLKQLHDDARASRAYCQLRSTKELVQAAYPLPEPVRETARSRRRRLGAIAASLLLFGVAFALLSGDFNRLERFALLDPHGAGSRPALAADGETRIVFHVVNSTRTQAPELLDEIEAVLKDYRAKGKKLRVEVVAHSAGLDLLRKRLASREAQQKIAALAKQYPNLTFVACLNTVERIAVTQGAEVLLVPEAKVTGSGVSYVVRRQQEGWIYIRV